MNTKHVDFKTKRTGSNMYDLIMVNATKRICNDIPDLNCSITDEEIRIFGDLSESDYAQYRKFISGGEQ